MKQSALLGLVWVALVLPCADGRKLGSTSTALSVSARSAPGLPLDLDALEVSVLRLTNASNGARAYLKPMIDSIRTMLEKELMPDISRQYRLAQKMLDDAGKGFNACKEPWNATQVGQVRDQHQSCRSQESGFVDHTKATCARAKSLEDVKAEKCAEMKRVDAYPQEAPAICDKDASDASYELHARRIRNFYMQKVHEWVLAEEACTTATRMAAESSNDCRAANETWKEKRSACSAIQRMLDMETCDAWTEYYHCSNNNSCLVEAIAAYLDANGTATAMQRSIGLQWRAMKRIECLLDALEFNPKADDLNDAITECRKKVHSVTGFALTYPYYKDGKPMMPSASKVCEEPSFAQPGKQSYEKSEYDVLPSAAPAEACAADCCTKCWYFSCNSTSVHKPDKNQLTGFSQEECCTAPASPVWKYDPWPQTSCATLCGLSAEYESRTVECVDLDTNVPLDESMCKKEKPATMRTKCEATPACGICEDTDCGSGYVLKYLVPDACRGQHCTAAECCNKVCSADDCPVGSVVRFPARICNGMTCDTSMCCESTAWKAWPWPKTANCSEECGQPEQIVNRSVTCEDAGGTTVDDRFCAGAKPASSHVACAATKACPHWVYSPWANWSIDCSARDCGLGQDTEERPVTCNDPNTQQVVADSLCKGPKPERIRILCPPTPLCVTTTSTSTTTTTTTSTQTTTSTTSTSTTTAISCDFYTCPRGYLPKEANRTEPCGGEACKAEDCCDLPTWVHKSWDETKECGQSCGLHEVVETRSVTCQVPATGKLLSAGSCQQTEPPSKRLLCPATSDCDGCGSVWCGADAVPLTNPPDCGSSCTRDLCCRKFGTGFVASSLQGGTSSVTNQGSSGGSVKFDGTVPEPSEGGHSYHLSGKTGLPLGGTKASEFTAVLYIKLLGSDGAKEETVMLKEGGPEDYGAWELVATPLKQFRLRSFKDSKSQASIGCLCLSSYADEWAAVTVRYDGKGQKIELLVNGKACCEAAASSDPSWSDAALQNSDAPVHLGLVLGSQRPGVAAEISAVQLWDGALTGADLHHLLAQFSQALAWSQPLHLYCRFNIISSRTGVASLAACRGLCSQDANCQSVQYQAAIQTCELRRGEVCTRAEGCACDASSDSLASNHCPGSDMVAPVTSQPDKLAHYPVTCTTGPKKPWWKNPEIDSPHPTHTVSGSTSTVTTTSTMTTTTTTTTTRTITRASCSSLTCPSGTVSKPPEKTDLCKKGECEVKECCDMAMWVYISWDQMQECNQTCGRDEVVETRSVTCQVPAQGKVVDEAMCSDTKPDSKRLLCSATDACQDCSGIQCGADEVPLADAPTCGSSCTRDVCCKKSVIGFQAVGAKEKVSAVANRGSSGGSLTVQGVAAEPGAEGHSYKLAGQTGLTLGVTKSIEFTALAYVKLSDSGNEQEGTVMLEEGGPDDHGAWELVATSAKQFRLRSYKDSRSQASIGCLCLPSFADEWAAVAVRYDGKGQKLDLMVNGKLCCAATASSEPSWTDAALRNSQAPVHVGLVPGAQRPGATAEVHAAQLWDIALTDAGLNHLFAQFSHVPAWSRPKQLSCQFNIVSTRKGIVSLAACRALCSREHGCKAVQYQAQTKSCELRSAAACTRKEGCSCDESADSLASNHCPDGKVVGPGTQQPVELAQYPVTCAAAADKPWWQNS